VEVSGRVEGHVADFAEGIPAAVQNGPHAVEFLEGAHEKTVLGGQFDDLLRREWAGCRLEGHNEQSAAPPHG